jgi:hypothetical protein
VTGSLLLAAAVPALCWAVSYPLVTALFVLVVAALVAVGRTLHGRVTGRSAPGPPVDAAEPTDRP